MNINRKFFKVMRYLMGPICIILIAVVVSAVGVILACTAKSSNGYIKATATISDMSPEDYDEEGNPIYKVYVDYEVDGTKYTHIEYNASSSSDKVGKEVTIYYNPDDPSQITSSIFIIYVPLIIGGVLLVIGVIYLIRNISKYRVYFKQEESYGINNEDFAKRASSANPFNIDNDAPIADWDKEDVKKYYFSFDNKIKQGYYLEDENRQIVYEAKMTKLTFVTAFEFEFINRIYGTSQKHKVGHTVSTDVNGMTTSSTFKFDGNNVWDLLHEKGIRIESNMTSPVSFNYEVSLLGNPFASINTAGSTLHEEDGRNPFTNVAIPGRYRVRTYTDDLDMLFLLLFALGRSGEQVIFD